MCGSKRTNGSVQSRHLTATRSIGNFVAVRTNRHVTMPRKRKVATPDPTLVRGSSVMILAKVIVPISMKPPRFFEKALVYRLAAEMPSTVIRYSRGLQHYKMLVTADRSVKTELIILWGPPGTGKSHRARTKWPDAYWLSRGNGQNIWWDSYAGQKVVIIDEFTGWMTKDQFCRLVDGTPFMVDTKGGRVPFAAELVVCTSNQDPWTWWEAPPTAFSAVWKKQRSTT